MAIKFTELKGKTLHSRDGEIGSIRDLLVDDRSWDLQYFVVDTNKWLPGRKVLLSPSSLVADRNTPGAELYIDLKKNEIRESPPFEEHLPVSRRYEESLHNHYGWEPYWGLAAPMGYPYRDMPHNSSSDTYLADHPEWGNLEEERQNRFEGHLHSLNDMRGYRIGTAKEKEFGEVADILVNARDWFVADFVLNSRKWIPGGKEFVCSPMFVNDINVKTQVLTVALTKEDMINGPDFDYETYGETYRRKLVKHYINRSVPTAKSPKRPTPVGASSSHETHSHPV